MSLQIRELSARYSAATVVRGVHLDVEAGQVTALVGANGVGKSTLMRSIAGLHRRCSGSVLLDGQELLGLPAHRIAQGGLALVPEGRHLFSELTVAENLHVALTGLGCDTSESRSRIMDAYDLFPILNDFAARPAGELSGGQQQMLAVARSFVRRPRVLLLDEPSLGLAPMLVTQILAVVRGLADHGVAVLLAEQNATAALRVADVGAVMDNGRLVRVDSASALLDDEEIRSHYLGGSPAAGSTAGEGRELPAILRERRL